MPIHREFKGRRYARWQDLPSFWRNLPDRGRATPFQSDLFLETWHDVFGTAAGVEPILVEITTGAGEPVALLPLVRTKAGARDEITFADFGVCDDNAPLLALGPPIDGAEAARLWRTAKAVFPGADIVRFERMPATIGGRPNPLALLETSRSALTAHPVELGDDWEQYLAARPRHFRKEQRRLWRVFERHAGATFELVRDTRKAAHVLAALESMQHRRLDELGVRHRLGDETVTRFYRTLTARGVADGGVVLGALLAGETVVAALLGIRQETRVTFVRIAHAEGVWRNCSPGRLAIDKTMEALHADGVRRFDLSIGDYGYKAMFDVASEPLFDLLQPLRLRGIAHAAIARTKVALRGTRVAALVKFITGG